MYNSYNKDCIQNIHRKKTKIMDGTFLTHLYCVEEITKFHGWCITHYSVYNPPIQLINNSFAMLWPMSDSLSAYYGDVCIKGPSKYIVRHDTKLARPSTSQHKIYHQILCSTALEYYTTSEVLLLQTLPAVQSGKQKTE